MIESKLPVYELPAIDDMVPRMNRNYIDNGMHKGISNPLWKGVITAYKMVRWYKISLVSLLKLWPG